MAQAETVKLRRCTVCKRDDLPTSAFYRNAAAPDGLMASCKQCRSDYVKRHDAEMRAARRASHNPPLSPGSVRIADDLPAVRIAHFLADTHSREFLIALCRDLGIVEESLP